MLLMPLMRMTPLFWMPAEPPMKASTHPRSRTATGRPTPNSLGTTPMAIRLGMASTWRVGDRLLPTTVLTMPATRRAGPRDEPSMYGGTGRSPR